MSEIDYTQVTEVSEYSSRPDYDDFVRLWPYEVVKKEVSGSYQGTIYYLLRRSDGKYGFCDISFGSCTVCDYLNGALNSTWGDSDLDPVDENNVNDIEEFFERKRQQITWHDADEMGERLQDDDNLSTSWRDYDTEAFVNALE